MNLVVATIPDDPADLAGWLEQRLTGLDLARLVSELTAIHKPQAGPSATELLSGHLPSIYSSGLSSVPVKTLRLLLTRPSLLLELQALVLSNGGPYWDQRLAGNPALEALVEQGRSVVPVTPPPRRTAPAGSRRAWYQRAWVVSLATAAAILVIVGAWIQLRPVPATGWGWDRPGALQTQATRADYLNSLASSADEWFAKRPESAPALAKRIGQFRQGCTTLLLAEHEPLPEADRVWLKERCRVWAGKFDQYLVDLEAGASPQSVRDAMDATVRQLTEALRKRAAA